MTATDFSTIERALISPNQRSPRAAPYQKIRQRLMESVRYL